MEAKENGGTLLGKRATMEKGNSKVSSDNTINTKRLKLDVVVDVGEHCKNLLKMCQEFGLKEVNICEIQHIRDMCVKLGSDKEANTTCQTIIQKFTEEMVFTPEVQLQIVDLLLFLAFVKQVRLVELYGMTQVQQKQAFNDLGNKHPQWAEIEKHVLNQDKEYVYHYLLGKIQEFVKKDVTGFWNKFIEVGKQLKEEHYASYTMLRSYVTQVLDLKQTTKQWPVKSEIFSNPLEMEGKHGNCSIWREKFPMPFVKRNEDNKWIFQVTEDMLDEIHWVWLRRNLNKDEVAAFHIELNDQKYPFIVMNGGMALVDKIKFFNIDNLLCKLFQDNKRESKMFSDGNGLQRALLKMKGERKGNAF